MANYGLLNTELPAQAGSAFMDAYTGAQQLALKNRLADVQMLQAYQQGRLQNAQLAHADKQGQIADIQIADAKQKQEANARVQAVYTSPEFQALKAKGDIPGAIKLLAYAAGDAAKLEALYKDNIEANKPIPGNQFGLYKPDGTQLVAPIPERTVIPAGGTLKVEGQPDFTAPREQAQASLPPYYDVVDGKPVLNPERYQQALELQRAGRTPAQPPAPQLVKDDQGNVLERDRQGNWTQAKGPDGKPIKSHIAGQVSPEQSKNIDAVNNQIDDLLKEIEANTGTVSGVVGPAGAATRMYETAKGVIPGLQDSPTPALTAQSKKELIIANVRKLIAGGGVFSNQDAARLDNAISMGLFSTKGSAIQGLKDLKAFLKDKQSTKNPDNGAWKDL